MGVQRGRFGNEIIFYVFDITFSMIKNNTTQESLIEFIISDLHASTYYFYSTFTSL